MQTEETTTTDDAAAKRAAMLARMAERRAARVRTPIQERDYRRGMFYREHVRPHVEPQRTGETAIIHEPTGDWIATADVAAGKAEMRARHPDGEIWMHSIWPVIKGLGGYQVQMALRAMADRQDAEATK